MYFLVDCNNFYASCERVFNPTFRDKPLIILSNQDGCVIARSNEAKVLGVPMGAPLYQYQSLIDEKNIIIRSANFSLYGDLSNRIVRVLQGFSSDIEIYSIDESFIKFADSYQTTYLEDIAFSMHQRILKWVGIPTSIGIASTKSLAKIANKIAKKFPEKTNSVYTIDTEYKRIKALKWTKIEDVWGIGRRLSVKLNALGVTNAFEFTQLSDDFIISRFSVVELRLKKELLGVSILDIDQVVTKQSIATTRSFDRNISDLLELKERIATFAVSCAEKLRKQKSHANCISVFLRTNRFNEQIPQHNPSIVLHLPFATNSSITLTKFALKGLQSVYKQGFAYKKAGVIVMGITPEEDYQINLFENENPKHKDLMKTIDSVNKKLGKKAIKLAVQDPKQTWKMRQDYLSPNYTTNLNEALIVK